MDNKHYDIFLKEFGKHLRQVRKGKGMSMEALSYKADIEYRQLGRIERGEVNTTLISLLRIANALEVDLDQFFKFNINK